MSDLTIILPTGAVPVLLGENTMLAKLFADIAEEAATGAGEALTAVTEAVGTAVAAVSDVLDARDESLTDIDTAKTGAIADVNEAGATQTANATAQAQLAALSVPFLLRSSLTAALGAVNGVKALVSADTGTHIAVAGEVALGGAAATVGAAIPNTGRYTYTSGVWLRTGDTEEQLAAAQVALAAASASTFTDVRAAVEGARLPYPTTYEAEATAYFAAAVTAGSARSNGQKYVVNRWIKKWKDAGIYSTIRGLWLMDDTLAVSRVNVVNPGTYNLIDVGVGPTFGSVRVGAGVTYNDNLLGAIAASSSSYLDTQIPLSSINQNDFCIGFYGRKGSASATYDFGNGDGTAGFGINAADSTNSNRPSIRAMGTAVAVPTPTLAYQAYSSTGRGMIAVQRRNDAANFEMIHDGMVKNVVASAAVASASANTLRIGRALNITTSASSYRFRASFVLSRGLTESELDLFYRGLRAIQFAFSFGNPSIRHEGTAPSKVVAHYVVYGWTLQGVLTAYEAARQGLSVALVGAWDDHTLDDIGGVSANGLGAGDIDAPAALSGVVKRMLDRVPNITGTGATGYNFPSYAMNYALRELLDPTRTTVSGSIALYETGGVISAQTQSLIATERRITSIKCADGTVFEGDHFADASYEGDLAFVSGVTTTFGTGTAGTGSEAIAGFVGRASEETGYGVNTGRVSVGATYFNLDPYVTPGVSGSGLLSPVKADGGWVKGQAMTTVQNYCFRQALTNNSARRRVQPTAPSGYSAGDFAVLERYFSTASGLALTPTADDLFRIVSLADGNYDFNNSAFLTLDIQESGTDFVNGATYQKRRVLKDRYMSFTDKLLYHLWASPSSAIPAGARTTLQGYSYSCENFLDPGPNDQAYKSSTLYVREARRIVGELVWDANDLVATDGAVPRSIRTVACASYAADSHVHFLFVDTSTGTPIIRAANAFFFKVNGANNLSPLPREIFLPLRAQAANLCVLFAGSWTHIAHGSIRMEFTSGQAAQSFGMLTAIAHENAGLAYMDVDDATFRTRMAALPEAVPAYLPQVN